MIKIESEFYKDVHELECKYAAKYGPIFDKVSLEYLFSKLFQHILHVTLKI